jgi:riboflavin synthase
MFTGIIEELGRVKKLEKNADNLIIYVNSPMAKELKVDQSLAHNGVCLTVEETQEEEYRVTAINETLLKTNLGKLKEGDLLNLERCLSYNGRLDGHIVQGHVDTTAILKSIVNENGSFRLTIEHPKAADFITVEKGSVCVNGISLTVVNSKETEFEVAIIPYTWENTNLKQLKQGDLVNLEFDILGKYVSKYMSQINSKKD